jgi:hypothetical protein
MKKLFLAFLIVLISFNLASAATTYYTNKASFNAAISGLSFESFEGQYSEGALLTFPGFTVEETGGINYITNYLSNAYFNSVTDGSNAIWYDDNDNSISTFAFNSSIKAFGVDITLAETQSLTVGGGLNYYFSSITANTPQFFGAISDNNFSQVTFAAGGGPEVGFDALYYGSGTTSVPEPTTLLLVGLGLMGVASMRKLKN